MEDLARSLTEDDCVIQSISAVYIYLGQIIGRVGCFGACKSQKSLAICKSGNGNRFCFRPRFLGNNREHIPIPGLERRKATRAMQIGQNFPRSLIVALGLVENIKVLVCMADDRSYLSFDIG